MDKAANALQMDPIALRLRNDNHPVRRHQWERALEAFDWKAKRNGGLPQNENTRRGVGAASSVWYNIVQQGVGATVEIYSDGTVQVLTGVQDIGGGIRTLVAQVAAEALHLPLDRISVRLGDSALPEGPGSGGSKTTASLTPAVHQAAHRALLKLAILAAPILGVEEKDIVFEEGWVKNKSETTRLSFQDLC